MYPYGSLAYDPADNLKIRPTKISPPKTKGEKYEKPLQTT